MLHFKILGAQFSSLIWAQNRRKLKLSTLQSPKLEAGMALPNLYYYFLVGQLWPLPDWLSPVTPAVVEFHLAHVLQLNSPLIALEAPKSVLEKMLPILNLARLVSHIAGFKDIEAALPLWHNTMFFQLLYFIDFSF